MKLKNLLFASLLVFSGFTAYGYFGPSETKVAEAASKTGTVTSTVNVRSSYSLKAKVVGSIKKGSSVTILASKSGFYQVKYGKKTGWVSTKYVKVKSTAKSPANSPVCSLKEFNSIKNGMTLSQVQSIIGSKGTITSEYRDGDFSASSYEFKGNTEFSFVYISFLNGKVDSKMQAGLK